MTTTTTTTIGFLLFWLCCSITITPSSAFVVPSYPTLPSSSLMIPSSSSSSSSSLHLFNSGKIKGVFSREPVVPPVEPGIGPYGCLLPSPSGINTLEGNKQIGVFLTYFVLLGIGVSVLEPTLDILATKFGPIEFSTRYIQPITIGLVYVLAGVTHFTVEDEYINIVPYKGAWGGLWQLPGPSKFHVEWTGVAEALGGIGLWIGAYYEIFQPPYEQSINVITNAGILSDSAACLFLLTLAVTPANIFMYTHGARLPMSEPPVGVEFHYIRFAFQIILLSLLLQMGGGSFDALLSSLSSSSL